MPTLLRYPFSCHLLPLLLVVLLASLVTGSLYSREPQSRHYYTLYIPNGNAAAAQEVAHQLDARYEGPVGELQQYHEISTSKATTLYHSSFNKRSSESDDSLAHDAMVKRFQQLKQTIQPLEAAKRDSTGGIYQVDSLRPQIPRRRIVKRAPPSPIYIKHSRRKRQEDGGGDSEETDSNDDEEEEDSNNSDPVIENIQHEQYLNALSSQDYLQLPDGFESLKLALNVDDPGFDQQWHLVNQEQQGHDVNITGVWSQGITGKNVVVAILDDGLDMDNEDLTANFFAAGSYDFNDHTDLPKPRLSDDTHGTRCAGEIAAVKNGVCGVGMAYDAKVAGIRILSADITDEDEARALNYKYQENHIYSCSWGPPDYGEVAEAPQGIVLDAIKNGINNGRNGTGTIYVFASGNGGGNDDNCNFDGYTNSIYTITVGAIDRLGKHPYYSERCSAQLVVTYSSGSGGNIYTTDIGQNKCTDRHGGTSAAAPLAAGVFALVLSVRPDLTWRDMQYLCVQTAVPLSLDDDDWSRLPSGRMYNHKFGYGKLDAYAIVEAAKTFENVGPQTYLQLSSPRNKRPIPSRSADIKALTDSVTITQAMVDAAGLARIEHVTATVYIEHERRGDLEVLLSSPQNVTSQLGAPRKYDVSESGLIDWTFMTVKHWDEDPVGEWTLHVIDWKNPQFTGSFTNWTLTLWGEMEEEVDGEIIHVATPAETIPPAPSHIPQEPSSQTTPLTPALSNTDPSTLVATQSSVSSMTGHSTTPSTTTSSTDPSTSPANDDTYEPNSSIDDDVSQQQERPDYTNYTDDATRTRKDSSTLAYYFYVVLLGMVVAGLSWMIRRRIKGPGSAKDITAYTNLSQQPYRRHDSYVYEFDMLNQGRRLPRLSEEDNDDNDDDNKDDKQGDITVVDVLRSTDSSPLKRQPSSSPPDYGKGK